MAERPRLTDAQEIGAYAGAHVIRVAAGYATTRFYAPALFGWAYAQAGMAGIALASIAQGVVWSAIGLAIFLALRPTLGGTPEIVRNAGGGATAGFELGAYALAQAIGIGIGYLLFSGLVPMLQPALGGRPGLMIGVSLALGAAIGAVEFVLFVLFRRGFAGDAGRVTQPLPDRP